MDAPIFDDSTWLVSDTHFFHANIGRYCNRPDGWQDLIIANWNRYIQPGDVVFHLGDLAFGKKDGLEDLLQQLHGKLHLIRGNHDRRGVSSYIALGIILIADPFRFSHPSGLALVFSHRPIVPLEPDVLNLHGHTHNNPTTELGPRHINLSVEVRDYRPWRLSDVIQPYLPG
ncbi:MAG: metallophosphoesterase [Chloroflexota bacterium]